jgi:hypothetical protein
MSSIKNKFELIQFMHQGRQSLKEINSNIEKLTISLDFTNNCEYSHKPYSVDLKPEDKAVFTPDCINLSCTKGFFDLTNVIDSLLRNNEISTSGELTCDGWQSSTKIGNHKCLATLSYEILAKYKV